MLLSLKNNYFTDAIRVENVFTNNKIEVIIFVTKISYTEIFVQTEAMINNKILLQFYIFSQFSSLFVGYEK